MVLLVVLRQVECLRLEVKVKAKVESGGVAVAESSSWRLSMRLNMMVRLLVVKSGMARGGGGLEDGVGAPVARGDRIRCSRALGLAGGVLGLDTLWREDGACCGGDVGSYAGDV